MRITELFRKPKPEQDAKIDWAWTWFDKNQVSAEFKVGEVPYQFVASQDPVENPGSWEVEFIDPTASNPFGVTGKGNAIQVFNTVIDIMREFINKKRKSIRRLTFAAKEDSRQGLYARMVKRLLPNWTSDQSGENFVVTRPGLSWWVYSVEQGFNTIEPIKIEAPSAAKAQEIATTNHNSPFNGADPIGMAASANKPRR